MGIIELIILAVGLAMDAFAVSICKGLAMQRVRIRECAIVGLWFGGFQAAMPLIGYFLGAAFKDYITKFDHWIAFILLALIGGMMIKDALSNEEEEKLLITDDYCKKMGDAIAEGIFNYLKSKS